MARKRKVTPEVIQQIQQLTQRGQTRTEIAKTLGLHRQTVGKYSCLFQAPPLWKQLLDSPSATLTLDETAKVLGVGRAMAYVQAKHGHIPTLKFGRRLVVPKAWLRRVLGLE